MRVRKPFVAPFVVLTLTLAMLLAACSKSSSSDNKAGPTTDRKAPSCKTFEGGKLTATWTDCPDKVKREVKCVTFVNSLKCDCYEDGVSKNWFNAADPPLSTRESATRVVNANCSWSLEMP